MPALSAGSLEPSGWSVQFAVAGILQSEGIGDAVEEGEEGGDVDGFGDLRVAVSGFSESDHLLVGGCGRFECQRFDELEQQFLFGVDLGVFEVSGFELFDDRVVFILQLQEVGVCVGSVLAVVESRDVGGDGFLLSSVEVAVGEVESIGGLHDLLQEIRSCREALEDFGHPVAIGVLFAPRLVDPGQFATGLIVFDPRDPGFRVHGVEFPFGAFGFGSWAISIRRSIRGSSISCDVPLGQRTTSFSIRSMDPSPKVTGSSVWER